MINYEYPLTERIRTFLRIEDLFGRARHFLDRGDSHDHHVVLVTLFEILEVCSRAELKSELLQELERDRQAMAAYRENEQADQTKLAQVLARIEQAQSDLLLAGKIGHHLRSNEWLMSIRQRANLPGGVCEFDLPTYHRWLHYPPERRSADMKSWIGPLLPIQEAAEVALGLLRDTGRAEPQIAVRGAYQKMMTGKVAQMVRISLPDSEPMVPETSANRYALNIRFLLATDEPRPRTCETDVAFQLTLCGV